MIRQRVVAQIREFALSLGSKANGSEWHLFGSVDRDELHPYDIDLMILCATDEQADLFRQLIDIDSYLLPVHLALMTFCEQYEISAVELQHSHIVFP